MYKNKKILAVIPARGGSKGIPGKNIADVNGRPLIDFTIVESLKSEYLDRVIVSTDSEEIAKISKKCGADVPFLRPEHLADDQSKTIDVLIDLVTQISLTEDEHFDYIVLLQPTQPLRKTFHIDEAIERIINNNYKSLLSVSLVDDNPILIRTINHNGILENLLDVNSTVRRQDFPIYYKVNGAIYINKIDDEFNEDISLNDNLLPYIMEKKYDLDIDEPIDIEILKIKLRLDKVDTN
jgi:CMP-N,N'-diacetyllegionaminic acid synthase